ncbi:MAG: MutS-related protein [Syntrophothermus sp.]
MYNISAAILSLLNLKRFSRKRKLETLRAVWGLPLERIPNFDLIRNYHDLVCKCSEGDVVDDKTWADLNFNEVYSLLDRNISGPGRQYLFHLLHKYETNDELLDNRFNQIMLFKENQAIREKIQLALQRISSDDTYFIISLLLGEKPVIPKYPLLIYLSSALSLLSILAAFYNSAFFFAVLFMSVLNLIITKTYSSRIVESFIGFSNLKKMIVSAYELSNLETEAAIGQFSVLKKYSGILKKLNKKVSHLVIDKTQMDTFAQIVIEYLNMFCLFDLVAYTKSVIELYRYKAELKEVFDAIASLDANISIASSLCSFPFYSKPEFIPENALTFDEVYHPLIDEAVPNSINGLSRSALITGSNMAGKTTFIKCIGVNIILSRTLGFTLSKRAIIPKLIVKSSIKIEDSIENSKSYYFTEVEEIQRFISLSNTEKKYLFIIDEIFRGTNTVERLGISTAVLKKLNHNNLVLVTTHDIELQDLLDNAFKMYHFNEQVDGDKYYFDFMIKEGPCSSGNAIKLLELMNYPEEVIVEAKQISSRILSSTGSTA